MRLRSALLTVWLCIGAAAARAQFVEGNIDAVGFRAQTTSGFVVRSGQWFPILTSLRTPGSQPFQGELRCETIDLDGDRVSHVVGPVALTPNAGMKRVWCYATTHLMTQPGGAPYTLDVLNASGAKIADLKLPPFDFLDNDTMLILDISDPPVVQFRTLHPSPTLGEDLDHKRPYYRSIVTAAMPAAELPDRWFGLEAANVLIWNRPDPDKISKDQAEALVQWVKAGGQLIVGVGDRWPQIVASPLAEIMPLAGPGKTVTAANLPVFARKFAIDAGEKGPPEFQQAVALTTARARDDALIVMRDAAPSGETIDLVTMRCAGAGRVTATAADLRALTPGWVDSRKFLEQLLELNPLSNKYRENEGSLVTQGMQTFRSDLYLYNDLVAPIHFAERSSWFAIAVGAFVVAYVALASTSYFVLKKYKRETLSWTVFLAFAIVASVLSLAAVAGGHAVSGGARQVNLVDGEMGAPDVHQTCLLGYSSRVRELIGLTLPGEASFLRPLAPPPRVGGAGESMYATPQRYECRPAEAKLVDAPLRATLKEFEGAWSGKTEGFIQGRLEVDRQTGRVKPESWIRNGLRTDFDEGFLLYIDPRIAGEVPHHAAGIPRNWRGENCPPAANVIVLRLPRFPAGAQLRDFGKPVYDSIDKTNQLNEAEKDAKRVDLGTLREMQEDWRRGGGLFPDYEFSWHTAERGALLLSTRSLALLNSDKSDFNEAAYRMSSESLADKDISHWLIRGQAVLLLATRDAGPAHIHRDGKQLSVDSFSLYRVRAPLDYSGAPPAPPPKPKEESK